MINRLLRLLLSLLLVMAAVVSCDLPDARLSLDKHRKILLVGASERLVALSPPSDESISWQSSNPSVAAVDSQGDLTGVSPGTAVVTASTASGLSEDCYVAVVTSIPRNIILFIGDGMGDGAMAAASIWEHGASGDLSFESFAHANSMTTSPADSAVTDSAAASTAMATGRKVNNSVVSRAIPGDGRDLETVVEFLAQRGKRTGLVTTDIIMGATPAGFGAHAGDRYDYNEIVDDFLHGSRPNLLFGGGGNDANGLSVALSEAAGYHTVTTKAAFLALAPESYQNYSAQFGIEFLPYMRDDSTTYPQLSQMTAKALALLENDPDGFFLLVEGARIDDAGHENDLANNIEETLAFEDAVDVALAWATGKTDILIIVAADHETGGLQILVNNGAGVLPAVSWASSNHTNAPVPIFAAGTTEDILFGRFDNTHIHDLITDFYE